MVEQTELEEKSIDLLLALLKEKHSLYQPETYAHYVVQGEYEEDCGGESFCENCIDKAVRYCRDYRSRTRSKKLLQLNDLEKKGYFFHLVYNEQYKCRSLAIYFAKRGDKKKIKSQRESIEKQFPKNQVFSYRYYQLNSTTSFENCADCGKIISSCVTPDEQEIGHWESLSDDYYIISSMDKYTAYEIYEWAQFIQQSEPDVYEKGIGVINRIIKLNSK